MGSLVLLFFFFFFVRYNQARNISRDLERQANRVLEEAEEAGNKALQIYANLTNLPTVDTTGLEVRDVHGFLRRTAIKAMLSG